MAVVNKPVISFDRKVMQVKGVSDEDVRQYFPKYILGVQPLYYGLAQQVWFFLIKLFLKAWVKIFLRPRPTQEVGSLDLSEVDRVYSREARSYNRKHHLTTRGQDLVWRRLAGWTALTLARCKPVKCLEILDLCTGTGLTAQIIASVLTQWDVRPEIIALDFNQAMLVAANQTVKDDSIKFVRGDAMDLLDQGQIDDLTRFAPNSFDLITQVCGIGGIDQPLKVFAGVLQILKPGGQFLMSDMHHPIPDFPGEWPLFFKWWLRLPILEAYVYEQITMPLVLKRLWAWRDTTALFYLLPLVVYQDSAGRYWGFEVQLFEQETQRWWFALPLMSVAKIVVDKIEISESAARKRQAILSCVKIS